MVDAWSAKPTPIPRKILPKIKLMTLGAPAWMPDPAETTPGYLEAYSKHLLSTNAAPCYHLYATRLSGLCIHEVGAKADAPNEQAHVLQ